MRYGIAHNGVGWVVHDGITGENVTRPATSEETQRAVTEWNARCTTRKVDPPMSVDGWGPAAS
jgi:phage baseplate assembly protein W